MYWKLYGVVQGYILQSVPQSVLPATPARSERSEHKCRSECSIQEFSVLHFFLCGWVCPNRRHHVSKTVKVMRYGEGIPVRHHVKSQMPSRRTNVVTAVGLQNNLMFAPTVLWCLEVLRHACRTVCTHFLQISTTDSSSVSTCTLHTNSGCGKERRILIGPWWSAKAAPVRNYLELYWPCAGGLSAVNTIGTQLRAPINSGLTPWRMAVL